MKLSTDIFRFQFLCVTVVKLYGHWPSDFTYNYAQTLQAGNEKLAINILKSEDYFYYYNVCWKIRDIPTGIFFSICRLK